MKRKMAKSNKKNIDTITGSIVCTETNIKLTDEKLRGILSKTYETARKDAQKFRIYNHYGVFLSVAFSLIIPLLTSEFQSFGVISADNLSVFCWVVFAISLVSGVVLVIIYASNAATNETSERDKAVESMLAMLQSQEAGSK